MLSFYAVAAPCIFFLLALAVLLVSVLITWSTHLLGDPRTYFGFYEEFTDDHARLLSESGFL